MSEAEFWSLIDTARAEAEGDPDKQAELLLGHLRGRSAAELEDFARIYQTLHVRAYRRDLWIAASLIDGGMSDDSFSDSRDWLISRGRDAYERALENPDHLADVPGARRGTITCESMHGVMFYAYEQTTGRELPAVGPAQPSYPPGPEWTTPDEFQRMLPRIVAKVRHRYDWDEELDR